MNAFSVDLEDWYQGIELPFDSWNQHTERIRKGLDPLLELLEKHNTKATFFTLGWIGEKYPELIKQITDAGHEMASHGYSHEKVYDLSPEAFREEISRTKKVLEDLSGTEVTSFRAPFFSVTNKSLWALDILKEEGYTIDCSISPVKTWRYGISTTPDEIFTIKENGLTEFPVSTFKLLTKNLGIGGAYFRLFPYMLTSNGLKQRVKKGKVNMFYIHPWEYDPHHPVVEMERKAKITHYTRLSKTIPFTDKLLGQFEFDTVSNVVKKYKAEREVNEYSIEILKD
ncbi:MAG: polysaccharide deacetylase family protein [Flavobacteriales bacterium]|nr:polysaccharide deacetylase family protein [Flavobacteriales bacterium]MCB9204586.1 polysaccharide deacetylase family protein [Flavobacteriales bacterium]